jgi:AcrR family transcriptional regulator
VPGLIKYLVIIFLVKVGGSMPDTEQKILEAALKVFAEKGYKGATTKLIAEESGFSEFTLFRKFKSKENLFKLVLIQSGHNFKKEFQAVLVDEDFENKRDFLEYLVKSLDQMAQHNLEFINLSLNEGKILEPVMEEFIQLLSQYIKIQLPGQEIDYECFAFSILCFIYMVNLDHHLGRSHCFDHEIGPEKFIDNLTLSLR